MRKVVLIATLLLHPVSLLAKDKPCSANPLITGTSFVVHGRLSLYNGSPSARIWQIGTHRVLGISDGRFHREGFANLPPELKSRLDFQTDLYGDFRVYPFTRAKQGVMQFICVEAAKKVVSKAVRKQQ